MAGQSFFIAGFTILAVAAAGRPGHAQGCRFDDLGAGIVRAITDGATLALEDGRQVRLDGIVVPRGSPVAAEAQAALTPLVGKTVKLKGLTAAPDRYGRLRAYVFVGGDNADRKSLEGALQHDMLRRGLARVAATGVGRGCGAALLAGERQARDAKLGIWADSAHAVLRADEPGAVLAAHGRLVLVEGLVLSVRESGGTIYVNFGRRWSEDFTVTIAKRNERTFAAAGMEPKRLERRRIRVRGVVEIRGGPWIEVTRPEQIELVGQY